MARTVKEEDYAAKRNEILDVAQRFIYTKGYELMSIQDILGELNISKGAFYHYFKSKEDLLEALMARMMADIDKVTRPIIEDPQLTAVEKLNHFFDTAGRWKVARRELMLAVLQVWYDDANAIVRQKINANSARWLSPLVAEVIRQGMREGTLNYPYPDQAGAILFAVLQTIGDALPGLFLQTENRQENLQRTKEILAACTYTIERLFEAPPGSLVFVDPAVLEPWFDDPKVSQILSDEKRADSKDYPGMGENNGFRHSSET